MTISSHSQTSETSLSRNVSRKMSVKEKPRTKILTGAEFLVNVLVDCGVTHVFGGHGGAVVPLIDAIVASPHLKWVCCRCEANASQAASAYAKLHGRLGCCIATSGPGAAHLLSGIIDAQQDRVPLIVLTGMKASSHLNFADFQDINQGSIFKMAGLAFSENVTHVHQLMPLTRNALTLSLASNECVHLAVPVDIQQQEIETKAHFGLGLAYHKKLNQVASRVQIETLVFALQAELDAERHVLICCGWRASKYGREVEQIAELLNAPILTSFDGKGSVDEHHPLSYGVVGVYGNAGTPSSVDLLENCDTIISVCVVDHTELLTNSMGLQVRRLIQIEERLLAGDALRFSPNITFSSGRLKESLMQVISQLTQTLKSDEFEKDTCSAWSGQEERAEGVARSDLLLKFKSERDVWQNLKPTFPSKLKPPGTPSTFLEGKYHDENALSSTQYCHPAVFFDIVGKTLREDAIVCADIGDNALWMASSLEAKRGQRFLTSEHMGIMGFAVNSGLAASVSCNSLSKKGQKNTRQTLIVAGDGGFQMSLNELATLRDHESKNVLVVVIVNSRLGRVQNETWGPRLNADGCRIGSPDYVKLFDAYGFPNGIRIDTSDRTTIAKVIEKGWSSAAEHGLCVIELRQDPEIHPVMHKLSSEERNIRNCSITLTTSTRKLIVNDAPVADIDTSTWQSQKEDIQGWLNNTLVRALSSNPHWIEPEVVNISPSEVLQEQLETMMGESFHGKVPNLFPTDESHKKFDFQFRNCLLKSFQSEGLESVFSEGISNTHPLCLQLFAYPKGFNLPLHVCPSIELNVPLVGEMREARSVNTFLDDVILRKTTKEEHCSKHPTEEELKEVADELKQHVVYEDHGQLGRFEEFDVLEGEVVVNETGCVLQPYTAAGNGCLIFALWSGVHVSFLPGNFHQRSGIDVLKDIDDLLKGTHKK